MKHVFSIFSLFIILHVSAQKPTLNISKQNVAINGYDVVAYFTEEKAIRGKETYIHTHEGVIYIFCSEMNKKHFAKNPSRYLPQYGGWCAYAMGKEGTKVDINPKTFKLLGGKLYLFYNTPGINTLNSWNEDEVNLKKKADGFWIDVK